MEPASKAKVKASGTVHVKMEPKPRQWSAQMRGVEQASGRSQGDSDEEKQDNDAEGEVNSGMEEPKAKRARVKIGPLRDVSIKCVSVLIILH